MVTKPCGNLRRESGFDRHVGGSAGATLAVDAGLISAAQKPSVPLQAAAGWSGNYDFTKTSAVKYAYVRCPSATDYATASCRSLESAASSINHINVATASTLLATSLDYTGKTATTSCEQVDPEQSKSMYAALQQAHISPLLNTNNECAHAFAYVDVELQPTLNWFHSVITR